jgi:hypothetical protein
MIDESDITVFKTIENLSVDVITKASLEWLCCPPKDSPLYQAYIILFFKTHPKDLENKRAELYTFPPVACSSSQHRLWLYAIEYFIKRREGESNYKITGVSEESSEISERLGDVLCSCFRICEYFYEIGFPTHPMFRFVPIAQDIYKLHFDVQDGTKGKEGKRQEITMYARKLVAGEDIMCRNPERLYPDINIDYELYLRFHQFIDLINSVSLSNKAFQKTYVGKKSSETSSEIGLSTALKQLASQNFNRSNSLGVVTVTKKNLKFNIGKGRGGKIVTQKLLKKLMF